MSGKEYADILNDIILKMCCTGFKFDVYANDGICIQLLRDISWFIEKKSRFNDKLQFVTYAGWSSIGEMFKLFGNTYELIYPEDENGELVSWIYSEINDHGFKFLEILSKSSSIEELKLKLQLIGY